MKIFCIGYNKTGSTSLYKALTDLGFNGSNLEKGELLMYDLIHNDIASILFYIKNNPSYEVYKDIPFSVRGVWRYLYEKYPDAKYILSERDTSEQWYNSITSFHRKLWNLSPNPTWDEVKEIKYRYKRYNKTGGMISDYLQYTFGSNKLPYDKNKLISSYEKHNKEVKEFFKEKENFITVNVSNDDDYQRLCKFLNKPISKDSKFPHYKKT